MAREVRPLIKSHIPPEEEMQDGVIAGYSWPPYTFMLERNFGKSSIECYDDGKWTHTVVKPTPDGLYVEQRFTKIVEAYVQETIDNAETEEEKKAVIS